MRVQTFADTLEDDERAASRDEVGLKFDAVFVSETKKTAEEVSEFDAFQTESSSFSRHAPDEGLNSPDESLGVSDRVH